VAAIIRRKKFDGHNLVRINEICIDTQARTVLVHNKTLDLTRKEFQLLLYFVSNRNRVISKNAMVDHLWGDEGGVNENYDIIYTHIKNLRKKLTEAGSEDYIQSIYGMGYKFSVS
jgi:DNA-binding response OmpR family regulator